MKKCKLFEPLKIRGLTLKNRIVVSPMCQYSSMDGSATDWHLVHLGSRAVGGAACVMVEASAVEPEGRISPDDSGIWAKDHVAPFKRINRFIVEQNCVPAIQLAHAGRKAATLPPWKGRGVLKEDNGGWKVKGPSDKPFDENHQIPHELTKEEIAALTEKFAQAAKRAVEAGFKLIEIHSAHGYLLHSFLSPLSNIREDEYGGSLENRTRFVREVVTAVRKVIPDEMPLFLRISATDWVDGGWDIDESVELAKMVKELGVDLVDCSSGALVPYAKIPQSPGYQVQFADRIKKEANILSGAVGLITEARQAEAILENELADIVLLARQMLIDPYWPLHAARELGHEIEWPVQYERGQELFKRQAD